MLRSEFLAVGKNDDPSTKLAPILTLIDGIESTGDDEIKADGACPLAGSIAGSAYTARDSNSNNLPTGTIEQFFKRKATIASRCQANWLVLFVYGQDTSRNGDRWLPWKLSRATRGFGDACHEKGVRTMVVGFIDPETQPDLAVTLDAMAKKGNPEASNAHAYLSDNVSELLQGLQNRLSLHQRRDGANSAPVVRPPLKGEREDIILSRRTRRNRTINGGPSLSHAISIDVSGNVLIGEVPLWDAGERLISGKATREGSTRGLDFSQAVRRRVLSRGAIWLTSARAMRRLFGTRWGFLPREPGSSLPGFVAPTCGIQTPEVANAGNWRTCSDRTSLWSVLLEEPTRIATTKRSPPPTETGNPRCTYKSNGGLLHAFDFETGDETWAFIRRMCSASIALWALSVTIFPVGLPVRGQTVPFPVFYSTVLSSWRT
jgi:type IV pilus assembly protein PilY1